MAGDAAPATLGNGFYIDNVVLTNEVPEPASVVLVGLGGLILWFTRRKSCTVYSPHEVS